MTRPAKQTRSSKPVLVRLTPDQYADLERLAKSTNRTMPDILRVGLTVLLASEGAGR